MFISFNKRSPFIALFTLLALSACDDAEAPRGDAEDDAFATTGDEDEGWETDDGESTGAANDDESFDFEAPLDPQAITGSGRITDNDTNPRWANVVGVFSATGSCSGTLISPVHVLSAGHCGNGVSVQIDAARSNTPAPDPRTYNVVQNKVLSVSPFSGQDLRVLVLDRAVPGFGGEGSPWFAATPAPLSSQFFNWSSAWTVGYGTTCSSPATQSRAGLRYSGGFQTYAAQSGVLTRLNLGCGNAAYRGPNGGDSGGPLLDNSGRVAGVFSGWSCRDTAGTIGAGGCQGTIEWTALDAANRAWINGAMQGDLDNDGIPDIDDPRPNLNCNGSSPPSACADVRPDFEVVSIGDVSCTGPGGDPSVQVTVRNNGPVTARSWVDVFEGLSAPPAMGTYSPTNYRRTNPLAFRESQVMSFVVTPANAGSWIDVLLDTDDLVDELSESNNTAAQSFTWPDCSFN